MLFCFLFSHGLVIKSPQWHFMPMVNETRGDYPVVGHYSHLVHGQRSANGGELPHRTTCTGVQNGDGGEGHRIDNYGVPVVEEGQLFLRMRVVFFFYYFYYYHRRSLWLQFDWFLWLGQRGVYANRTLNRVYATGT